MKKVISWSFGTLSALFLISGLIVLNKGEKDDDR